VIERKRKLMRQHQSGSSSMLHVAMSSAGPVFHPAQSQFQPRSQAAGQGFSIPQRQVIQRSNNFQTPAAGNQNVQRIQAAQDPLQADRKYYNCVKNGYYANRCPNLRTHANQPATTTPAPTHRADSVSVAAMQNYARGSQSCDRERSARGS
jgi:hypothetical protein